ncbi:PREDICTED: succinate dehydrogenase cytochrome b560 subunit, mitochondrial-like [Amphimedon queenslandica]|uniref:Uncharacterized protein n=1 Tax=Amphimedon queenslandica TaxID=400682 RepID=A0A1X7URC8_AMPQE|nr:PREDICTED: succinate dehydrogenase cytochrome b560 subunit, mitochondrial-like [Amphimedon queenslandica]|eukprot:XP_003387087.1 PREDICTED: succinate dehydrogenase cytochrome b560 subunit, mitochondrial-like [Amphimedon queenslandica]
MASCLLRSSLRLSSFSTLRVAVMSRQAVVNTSLQSTSIICCRKSGTMANGDFFERNKELNRPISPHLSILLSNPQLPAMLSISHRITGVILSFDLWATTLAWLSSGKSFPQFITAIQELSVHPYLIFGCKTGLAFAFTYHFFNSFRHFMWDSGKGFQMSTVYRTGYLVLIAASLSAIGLALYTPKL